MDAERLSPQPAATARNRRGRQVGGRRVPRHTVHCCVIGWRQCRVSVGSPTSQLEGCRPVHWPWADGNGAPPWATAAAVDGGVGTTRPTHSRGGGLLFLGGRRCHSAIRGGRPTLAGPARIGTPAAWRRGASLRRTRCSRRIRRDWPQCIQWGDDTNPPPRVGIPSPCTGPPPLLGRLVYPRSVDGDDTGGRSYAHAARRERGYERAGRVLSGISTTPLDGPPQPRTGHEGKLSSESQPEPSPIYWRAVTHPDTVVDPTPSHPAKLLRLTSSTHYHQPLAAGLTRGGLPPPPPRTARPAPWHPPDVCRWL